MGIELNLTHPGGAHKDEFLDCCLLAAQHGAPIVRREPGQADQDIGESANVAGLVYPDRRGSGDGMCRHNDHPRLEFTRIDGLDDVHFAHARGFVAKTFATEGERLKELVAASWV